MVNERRSQHSQGNIWLSPLYRFYAVVKAAYVSLWCKFVEMEM